MVSVIIVSFNTREILAECLMSLFRHAGEVPMEVFVVDNASKDGSPSMVRERFPAVRLIENSDNRGFAAANNQAYTLSQGDYVVLLNPDAYLQPESLANAVAFMDRTTGCGLSGGKIISPKGTLEPSARRFPSIRSKLLTISGISGRYPRSPILNRHEFGGFNHDAPMEVDWVPGTFTIIRRSMLESIGFFRRTLLSLLRRDRPLPPCEKCRLERVFHSRCGSHTYRRGMQQDEKGKDF